METNSFLGAPKRPVSVSVVVGKQGQTKANNDNNNNNDDNNSIQSRGLAFPQSDFLRRLQ